MRGADKYVYFIKPINLSGPVKIGASQEPDGRLGAASVWSPIKLELAAIAPGSFVDENYLHRQFAQNRMHGEWFAWSPELQTVIDHVMVSGALPEKQNDLSNAGMAEAYCSGQSLQQIGDRYGLTRERVRQILRADGVASLGYREHHKKRSIAENCAERVVVMASAGATLRAIADEIGDTVASVRLTLKRRDITLERPEKTTPETRAKAQLIAQDYQSGLTTSEIATRHGTQQPMVYRYLKIAGVAPARRPHKARKATQ